MKDSARIPDSDIEAQIARTLAWISGRLREERKARGWTVNELALRAGMERPNLSRVESARGNISVRTICRICFAMGMTFRELLECRQDDREERQNDIPEDE